MIIATDRRQSRVIFRYIRGVFERSRLLGQMVEREVSDGFDLDNSVTIEVMTAQHRTVRGYSIAASKAIATSINDGDDILVAALLSGPAMLSGMSQAGVDHAREQWRRARLPNDCARIDRLKKAAEHLARGGALTLAYQSKCSDPSIIAAAKESQRKADAAVAAANAALMH